MFESLVKNYAEALFSLSLDNDNYLEIQKEMKTLKQVLNENEEFVSLLCSSFLSLKEKENIIDKVLSEFNEDVKSLLKVICKNRRASIISNVIDEYNTLVNRKRGVLEGLVYTIYPLKEKELSDIEKKISEIEKVPCELKNIIDATIIGGVKVAINGHVYDGSIANKIEQMRLTLNKQEVFNMKINTGEISALIKQQIKD